jgi:alpha-L-fucosidase 2
MKYKARVHVEMPKGGSLSHSDTTLTVNDASEVIIYACMATDYRSDDMDERLANAFEKASKEKYQALREKHVSEYRKWYDRVEVSFGQTENAALPIDQRLHAFNQGEPDPDLMALYLQFGRYLLISSTRPGSLPPNLQGIWANEVQSPWNGDYHLNINVQMNHWPAEITNLSELHMPLIEWTKSQVKSGERTAKVFYNARGWVTHIIGNLWEFTAPTKFPAWGATNTCAAWLCRHMYEHYLFTQDTVYLREVYPVMREAALFFTDVLVENPSTGYLVTAPTNSPENAFIDHSGNVVSVCAGTTMDNQIIRELFSNTIAAAELLDLDSVFVAELKEKRSRLMPTTIGPDGRIMEWLEPYKEVEPEHRHVSHLFGLFPGSEISSELTPDLAEAARQSLIVRGDVSTGWSMAWKVNFWARLRDGEHAYKLLTDLLRPSVDPVTLKTKGGGTYPNLFCAHPPFQIDGNFGGCAGIAEMLLQSQSDCVEILPALPAAWQTGYYKGLKARGGGEVSANWKDGRLQTASLKCVVKSNEFRIKLPADGENVRAKIDRRTVQLPIVDDMLTVELKRDQELFLDFTR